MCLRRPYHTMELMVPGDSKEFPWAAIERYSPVSGTMKDLVPGGISLVDVAYETLVALE
jgi:hypothetical protein